MLRWALILLIVALIAAALGFTDVAAASAGIAKVIFFIFVLLFALVVLGGLFLGSRLRW